MVRLLDLLFRAHFVYFKKLDRVGAESAAVLYSASLGANLMTIIFFLLSLIVQIESLGKIGIGVVMLLVLTATDLILHKVYVKNERYKSLTEFAFSAPYVILSIIHVIFSIVIFVLVFIALLGSDNRIVQFYI